ncbi:calcium-binding protein [Phenylobacterium sp.]|uniref:calcium-binding protein n=1 Tax=Phenylobacterium sp. TaxID=1871053 RepID=UPI002ED99ED0
MSIINSTPNKLDMQAWAYRGMSVAELRQVNSTGGELYFQSSFDPYAFASVPEQHTYAMQLRLRGTGFADFDSNGVPRSGLVTGATLANNFGFLVYFEGLSVPVSQFMAVLGSRDPAALRSLLLGGNDQIVGGTNETGIGGSSVGDILLGLAGNDTLAGGGGHDSIDGGAGDDTIVSVYGATTGHHGESRSVIVGGDGVDAVDYQFATAAIEIDLVRGVAGYDTLSGIENAFGTPFGDRITGNDVQNSLFGNDGADTITGGGGDDFINGGAGVDRVSAGDGGDAILLLGEHELIDGGAGVDQVNYGGAAQAVVVNLATGIGTDTLSGVEYVTGSFHAGDLITGSAGADFLFGGGDGPDSVFGGAGADYISGAGYLRGDEGNDQIQGGGQFDDINGNMGDDLLYGHGGGDWVVGGKDNDTLSGGVGADIVYGNLGSDICNGDEGDDTVRGGQADDVLDGGAGNDWLSGDRGSDVIRGGAGADIFHSFGEADADTVLDFNAAEGDRVMLDPGTIYTLEQVGPDTLIRMGASTLVLSNVSLATLPAGWLFGA